MNPPSFAKFRFFLVRFTSAPCLVITRCLCSSNKEIWSNGTSTVNVCTIAVRWASARPRLRCDQQRPSSLALPTGLRRFSKKIRSRRYQHFLSSWIAQRTVCHSCKVLQNTMKRTKNPKWTDKPSTFLSVSAEGEAAINPSQTLLLLVHLSRFI